MFQKGTAVIVGYAPDYRCQANARHVRLQIGTIVDGPHSGLGIRSPAWRVDVGGQVCVVNESLLTPFDDPDTATETTEQQAVEA